MLIFFNSTQNHSQTEHMRGVKHPPHLLNNYSVIGKPIGNCVQ